MKQTHTEGIMEIKIKNKNLEMYIWTREARFTERIHKWKANLKHGRYNRMDGHISEKNVKSNTSRYKISRKSRIIWKDKILEY